jgi:hypothetical protein
MLEGYEQGIVPSWYFAPIEKKFEMQEYRAVRKPIYMREFPTGKIVMLFLLQFFFFFFHKHIFQMPLYLFPSNTAVLLAWRDIDRGIEELNQSKAAV